MWFIFFKILLKDTQELTCSFKVYGVLLLVEL